MRLAEAFSSKGIGTSWWTLVAVLVLLAPAYGQHFDITPLFGLRTGGSMTVQQEGQPPQAQAHLGESAIFGVAAGFRFFGEDGCEDCSVIEFRWTRQNTDLALKDTTPVATPFSIPFGKTSVNFDHYLADFSYEFKLEQASTVRPFVMASMGVAHMSAAASGSTRFVFGIGGGVKIFPRPHWGIRFQAEYIPTVLHAEVQRLVCSGGCIIALGGGLLNQFGFTAGPVFRF